MSSWGVESTLTASAALTGRVGRRGGGAGVDHFTGGDADDSKVTESSSASVKDENDKFFGSGTGEEIISLIPDLDDAASEAADLKRQVAEAPRAAMRRVLDISELDREMKHSSYSQVSSLTPQWR